MVQREECAVICFCFRSLIDRWKTHDSQPTPFAYEKQLSASSSTTSLTHLETHALSSSAYHSSNAHISTTSTGHLSSSGHHHAWSSHHHQQPSTTSSHQPTTTTGSNHKSSCSLVFLDSVCADCVVSYNTASTSSTTTSTVKGNKMRDFADENLSVCVSLCVSFP